MREKGLILSVILLCCAGWASAAVVDYVSYWAFDGNDNDASANAYNLASTSPIYNTGVAGQAAVFNETDETKRTISASSAPNIWGISPELTISFWMYVPSTQTASYSFIFNAFNSSGDHRKLMFYWWNSGTNINDIQVNFSQDGTSGASAYLKDDNATPTRDTWYHIVAVLNLDTVGTDTFIYATPYSATDVALTASKDSGLSGLETSDPGSTIISIADSFNGMIDEMVIYNRALDGEEVQTLFDLGKNGQSIPEPASVAVLSVCIVGALCRGRKRR